MFPDHLESVQTIQKVSRRDDNFTDGQESFMIISKFSRLSWKFPVHLNSFQPGNSRVSGTALGEDSSLRSLLRGGPIDQAHSVGSALNPSGICPAVLWPRCEYLLMKGMNRPKA